jgi:uncharacterized protein YuzE
VGETLEIQEDCGTLTIEYDKDIDIMYIKLKEGKYAFSEEINDSAMMDLDPEGRTIAVEVHDVSDVLGKELLQGTLKSEAAILT